MGKIIFLTNRTKLGSDKCRGNDIAEAMNQPVDIPVDQITENDTVIMIKHINPNVLKRTKKVYCDLVDGVEFFYSKLKVHPEITIICLTPTACKIFQQWLPKHKIIWIPHSHCNNENRVRPSDRPVENVVYNGTEYGFPKHNFEELKKLLGPFGFRFYYSHTIMEGKDKQYAREKCCDSYYNADIAVAFRSLTTFHNLPLGAKSPTKLNNAGSFKVPTIAFPEPAFVNNYDKVGHFCRANTIHDMVNICMRLKKDNAFYKSMAEKSYQDAQPYHISKIVKWYEALI